MPNNNNRTDNLTHVNDTTAYTLEASSLASVINAAQETEKKKPKKRPTPEHITAVRGMRDTLVELKRQVERWYNDEDGDGGDRTQRQAFLVVMENINSRVYEINNWFNKADDARMSCPDYPLCTLEWYKDTTGYAKLKRPVPKSVILKQNQQLEVYKTLYGRSAWTKADQKTLIAEVAKAKKYWNDYKALPTNRKTIKDLRAKRKSVDQYLYRFKRGPFESTTQIPTNESPLKALKSAYADLRRRINHERMRTKNVRPREGHFGYKSKGVYMQTGMVLKKKRKKLKKHLYEYKSPKTTNRYVGVELEFLAKVDAEQFTDMLMDAGLSSYVTLKTDGSLRTSSPEDFSHELCILVAEKDSAEVIKKACAVIKEAGGYVNKTCGLHVHLDMRSRSVEDSYDRLLKSLDIMYAMTPPDRRHNKYCQRNAIGSTWSSHGGNSADRYYAINTASFQKHKTIEIRLHSGSINPMKINYWVQLLTLIIGTRVAKNYRNPVTFIQDLKIPEGLANYMLLRIAKFQEDDVNNEDDHVSEIFDPNRDTGSICTCGDCRLSRRVNLTGAAPSYAEAG